MKIVLLSFQSYLSNNLLKLIGIVQHLLDCVIRVEVQRLALQLLEIELGLIMPPLDSDFLAPELLLLDETQKVGLGLQAEYLDSVGD